MTSHDNTSYKLNCVLYIYIYNKFLQLLDIMATVYKSNNIPEVVIQPHCIRELGNHFITEDVMILQIWVGKSKVICFKVLNSPDASLVLCVADESPWWTGRCQPLLPFWPSPVASRYRGRHQSCPHHHFRQSTNMTIIVMYNDNSFIAVYTLTCTLL